MGVVRIKNGKKIPGSLNLRFFLSVTQIRTFDSFLTIDRSNCTSHDRTHTSRRKDEKRVVVSRTFVTVHSTPVIDSKMTNDYVNTYAIESMFQVRT